MNGSGATTAEAPDLANQAATSVFEGNAAQIADRNADATLMARAAEGDDAAFSSLYQTHRRRVFRLAYAMVLDREEAREVTQDVFIALHRVAPSWRPQARVATWLQRTTFRIASGWRRKLRRWSKSALTVATPPSAEATTDAAAHWEVARRALAALPPRQRGVVELHLRDSLTPAEIATTLGITSNAARVSLHKGMARLRATMEAQGAGREP